MTLYEEKRKVLGLIEELNPDSEFLTDDPDIATKINEVFNQVMYELARMKKIPRYIELAVAAGGRVTFEDLERECGYAVYQLGQVCGPDHEQKAGGTLLKFLESGTAEIDVYVYPERITETTKDKSYEFELSADVLEIMPYGVAADLLKSDVSADYGTVYAQRYRDMLDRLDPRYSLPTVTFEGGVII